MKYGKTNRKAFIWMLAGLGLIGIVIVPLTFGAQVFSAMPRPTATPVVQRREVIGEIESPTISFISNPSATCSLPAPGTGACYIQWEYLNVTAASSSYIISMTVQIEDRVRAYHSGFFQNSMYIPAQMTAPGYKVVCGEPNPAGPPGLGNSYNYTIRARDSDGLSAANYGTVTCPADVVRLFLPVIQKR
jgi:hypothetical protein